MGPAPKGKGRFVGGDRQSRRAPAGRRALTSKRSRIEEGRKAGHGTAGAELQIKTSKVALIEARQRIGRNPESRKQSNWNDCSANPDVGRLSGEMVKRDGPLKRTASTRSDARTEHGTSSDPELTQVTAKRSLLRESDLKKRITERDRRVPRSIHVE